MRIAFEEFYKDKKHWLVHAELLDFPIDSKNRNVKTLVFEPTEAKAIKRAYQIYTRHPNVIADNINIKLVEQLEER